MKGKAMKHHKKRGEMISAILIIAIMLLSPAITPMGAPLAHAVTPAEYQAFPVEAAQVVPPSVMLVMGRDHKLYYEAYNDASDLNEDGTLDIRYSPAIEYYGYFDSYKYYEYDSGDRRFVPVGTTSDKKAPSGDYWSGDFLNYLTMSRMDAVRKVLYGGYRSVDTDSETVLERAYIPDDTHAWGKEYSNSATDGYLISDYTPLSEPSAGRRHLFATGSRIARGDSGYAPLLRVKENSDKRIWDWVSAISGQIMTDVPVGAADNEYIVRVLVCDSGMLENNCTEYPDSNKPTGLLQKYGETGQMNFGLLTGSYEKHLSGGVLRKNIGPITDEINPDTGQFKYKTDAVQGIIKTIDNLQIIGFDHGSNNWDTLKYYAPINEGENYMWGNPVAEMMYETLRYFSGVGATSAFSSGVASGNDRGLDLPHETWVDPYDSAPYCSQPVMLVISDINPSYDTDQLPGVYGSFNSGFSGTLGDLDVAKGLDTISGEEGIGGEHYIGQSGGSYDTACSGKTVSSLASIRGLCPEEPTKLGGYYAASVAHYGHTTDLNDSVEGEQKVDTYMVGLASPLPEIQISMAGGQTITLVPFAKTIYATWSAACDGTSPCVKPCRASDPTCDHGFQPTCALVDFYVEELTDTHGKFRVNYEHAEQGSDFDMDAIITYEYTKQADGSLDVYMESSTVSGGSTKQHFGYIISGTTADGVYMEIKNASQPDSEDQDYYLDTPPGVGPNQGPADLNWEDGVPLPNATTRTFTPGGGSVATLLKNPLYYAAKYGGFNDKNENGLPDDRRPLDPESKSEWDTDYDDIPDNYFYVINPLRLQAQLNASFSQILAKSASATSASVLAATNEGEGTLIQAYFRPTTTIGSVEVQWTGYLQSLWIDSRGLIREDTNGDLKLNPAEDRVIVFQLDLNKKITIVKRFGVDAGNQYPDTNSAKYNEIDIIDILPLWEAGRVLADTSSLDRKIFTTVSGTSDEVFHESNSDAIKHLLGVSDADIATFPDANIELLGADLDTRAQTLINYIRGEEIPSLRNRTFGGKVWKLGDIVHSTPVSVSKPVEQYHIIYSDASYGAYVDSAKNRQTVVYAGSNDGMLHAFTSWRYNSSTNAFEKPEENPSPGQGDTIGDELWAYVPRAVLPHLKWLSDPQYSHTYYVDMTPRVFDAKIAGAGQNEWGTFLLLGLNMGGNDIRVDADGDGTADMLKPSYTLLDITDPLNPELIWERTYDGLGMSRSMPAIIKTGGNHFRPNGTLEDSGRPEQWLAVFGSGPQGPLAYHGISNQPARVYVIDLKTGNPFGANDYLFTLSDNSVVNSPVALDKGLNYEVNAIYLGESISANPAIPDSNWTGKAWTIDTYENWTGVDEHGEIDPDYWDVINTPTAWHLHLLMQEFQPESTPSPISLGPITAPMSLSVDFDDNVWVYFGTGRFLSEQDKSSDAPQHLFGLKDPLFHDIRKYVFDGYVPAGPQGIPADNLLNASRYRVNTDLTVEYDNGVSWEDFGTWQDLLDLIHQDNKIVGETVVVDNDWRDGWSRNLETGLPSERCVSKCTLLGGAVFVPAYTPSQEPCAFGGTSNLYGLYFETGTGYHRPFFSSGGEVLPLGQGAPPPISGIHIGREKGGKAFLQMSTGEIIETNVETALPLKSRMVDWID